MKQLLLVWFSTMFVYCNAFSQLYVAPGGSDNNEGSKEKPFATIATALRKVREMRRLNDPSIQNGIEIIVEDGVYYFNEPLFIRPEDAGTTESPTTIAADAGAHPVFSGGVRITGWKKLASRINGLPTSAIGKVWVADVQAIKENHIPVRQLWVNGIKATRAKEANGDSMRRILSWDHASQTCWVPRPKNFATSNIGGMEMFIHQWWAIAILRIKSIKLSGDSMQLSFHQPESRIESEHPWPAPWISKKTGNSAFNLINAIQFLDRPGEWYYDEAAGRIYYYPRFNENLITASVIAPQLETLVKMEGTIDHPISNLYFKGISFQHTSWLRPSQHGHVPLQAGMYLLDAYKLKIPGTSERKGLENQAWIGRPSAAVEVCYATHTGFEACRFEHLASTGLDYKRGTHHDEIVGNLFKDIGGSGMLIGTFSDESVETHLPYNPKDDREVCSDENIANNLITDVTNEDWGCVGIGAGYVRGINIQHNEVCNVSYTGISLGWGWTKGDNVMRDNKVFANRISHYAKHMYDVAGIYTLSSQPGTLISSNYIDSIYFAPYAHDPNHWFYIYTDEGSSYIMIKNNWCPTEKFLQNANGPGNTWENNGQMVNDSVRSLAGLEEQYGNLAKERTIDIQYRINHTASEETQLTKTGSPNNLPVVVELIIKKYEHFTKAAILHFFKQQGIASNNVFQWQNHFVGLGYKKDSFDFTNEFTGKKYAGSSVKVYDNPVYVFDRQRCRDQTPAAEWDNIILTANLVKDVKLQKEYLQYHATQFEKWPEVSKGFCNADFQQLLVLKSGRQLMLIISIPKGKTLEELNPKTTENNPRVDEWNQLMKKYQEGIEGAKPSEVWVQFKPITQ